jgi:hypothetical protein
MCDRYSVYYNLNILYVDTVMYKLINIFSRDVVCSTVTSLSDNENIVELIKISVTKRSKLTKVSKQTAQKHRLKNNTFPVNL